MRSRRFHAALGNPHSSTQLALMAVMSGLVTLGRSLRTLDVLGLVHQGERLSGGSASADGNRSTLRRQAGRILRAPPLSPYNRHELALIHGTPRRSVRSHLPDRCGWHGRGVSG